MTIREVLEDASRRSASELRNLAINSSIMVLKFLENCGLNGEEQTHFIVNLFKLFVSADRNTTREEYELFLSLLNLSQSEFSAEKFFELTNGGANPNFIASFKELFHKMTEDVAHACCYLGVAIMACDRDIDEAEVKLLENLLN